MPTVAFLLIVPVHATTPMMVTGTIIFVAPPYTTHSRSVDGTLFSTFIAIEDIAGGIQGQLRLIVNSVQTSSILTANGEGTFIGTVSGSQSGTAIIHVTITGTVVSGTVTSFQGQLIFGKGTGGLSSLHAQGTFKGVMNQVMTYSESIHFDPA